MKSECRKTYYWGEKIFLLLNNTVSIKQQLKRNSCHTCASSGPRFFLKLDFVVNIRKTAGTPLHILKKPSVLAEFNGIRDSFLQRPDLPPQFLQLVRRHWSWVIHVTDALPADRVKVRLLLASVYHFIKSTKKTREMSAKLREGLLAHERVLSVHALQ